MANKSQKGTTKRLSSQERDANKLHKLLSSPQWGVVSAADTFREWTGEGSRLAWALAQVKAYEAAAPERAARKAAEAAKASIIKDTFILKYSLSAWAVLGNTASTLGVFASQVEAALDLVVQAEKDLAWAKSSSDKAGIQIRQKNLNWSIAKLEELVTLPEEGVATAPVTVEKLMLAFYANLGLEQPLAPMFSAKMGYTQPSSPSTTPKVVKKQKKEVVLPDLFSKGYSCHRRDDGSVYYTKNGIKYTPMGKRFPTPIMIDESYSVEKPYKPSAEELRAFRMEQKLQAALVAAEAEEFRLAKEQQEKLERAAQWGVDLALSEIQKAVEKQVNEQLAKLQAAKAKEEARLEELRKAKAAAAQHRAEMAKRHEAVIDAVVQQAFEKTLASVNVSSLVEAALAKKAKELGLSKYLAA